MEYHLIGLYQQQLIYEILNKNDTLQLITREPVRKRMQLIGDQIQLLKWRFNQEYSG